MGDGTRTTGQRTADQGNGNGRPPVSSRVGESTGSGNRRAVLNHFLGIAVEEHRQRAEGGTFNAQHSTFNAEGGRRGSDQSKKQKVESRNLKR